MRRRRAIAWSVVIAGVCMAVFSTVPSLLEQYLPQSESATLVQQGPGQAQEALETLEVKGRASKAGYSRDQFGGGWKEVAGCSTRDIILYRDLSSTILDDDCGVRSGLLQDPYTGEEIHFSSDDASAVQIDHVVALSDAWQKGAQQLSFEAREQLANDPLELLAVDGPANQQKGDGDAATWLPSYKPFRCSYVARQIAVKQKYSLWVTQPEKDAMLRVLQACPSQELPVP